MTLQDFFCQRPCDPFTPTEVILLSAAYLPFCLLVAFAMVMQWRAGKRDSLLASIAILLSFMLRFSWLPLTLDSHCEESFERSRARILSGRLLNRVSLLLQFTALTFIIMHWARMNAPFRQHHRVMRVFVAGNVVTYVSVLGTTYFRHCLIYRTNVILLALAFLTVSVGFLHYGLRLHRRLTSARVTWRRPAATRLLLASLSCTLCFALRAYAFGVPQKPPLGALWYPISFYHIPDIIPSCLILLLLLPPSSKQVLRANHQRRRQSVAALATSVKAAVLSDATLARVASRAQMARSGVAALAARAQRGCSREWLHAALAARFAWHAVSIRATEMEVWDETMGTVVPALFYGRSVFAAVWVAPLEPHSLAAAELATWDGPSDAAWRELGRTERLNVTAPDAGEEGSTVDGGLVGTAYAADLAYVCADSFRATFSAAITVCESVFEDVALRVEVRGSAGALTSCMRFRACVLTCSITRSPPSVPTLLAAPRGSCTP